MIVASVFLRVHFFFPLAFSFLRPVLLTMLQAPMIGGMNSHDICRTKYIPSLATVQYKFNAADQVGDNKEKVWNEDLSGHAALRIPVPADHQMDLQTFFFGPMTHTLSLRPRRPPTGCCACTQPFVFDLAADLFGPAFATGEISNSPCAPCCGHEVTVNLPSGQMKGKISNPICSLQHRKNLEWSTGEVMSYRYMPCSVFCGPWRTGFVGTAPGEEENYQIRFWEYSGQLIECNMTALCLTCFAPCRICCFELKHCLKSCCESEWHYTSWAMRTLVEMRSLLLVNYSYVLRSAFGEPQYSIIGDEIQIDYRHPTFYSDINALGNWRVSAHKNACCKIMMTESADTPNDLSKATAFDLTFRGTFNQNVLDPRDFNLALGFLVMQFYFYTLPRAQSDKFGLLHSLWGWYYRAHMTPRQGTSYIAPPLPVVMGAPPPPGKTEDFL
ncbi:membrane-associated protein, putative [Bodo saltans]|uniref:Membrane-associated protein, putative n=1 Tax=Bodo saltans TaxID=75058 RepID=A0A0S4ILH4_BODSA|nr:membrane-associated protein, putative [Bodo saltans]|eukprot:CUE71330.1 membrane-associated protein, putative [Bodo saltans]